MGTTLGVVGLGAIGVMVANTALSLGMEVIGYDPYLSVDAAWNLSRSAKKAADLKDIFANCDYITLHLPLNDSTRSMPVSYTHLPLHIIVTKLALCKAAPLAAIFC